MALTALALTVLSGPAVAAATPMAGGAKNAGPRDWPGHNSAGEDAYSALDGINKSNVKALGLEWSLDLDGEQSLEATPLAVDGVLYFTGSHAAVYAVDAATGKLKWKFDPQTWKHNPAKLDLDAPHQSGCGVRRRTRVFRHPRWAPDCAGCQTGTLLWSTQTVPESGGKTITGAPRTFKGKVIIGNAGADAGERGYVTAYDAATGRQVWRFYTTPGSPEENKGDPAMERAAATWSGEYWKTGTGGGVWDSITFDAATEPHLSRDRQCRTLRSRPTQSRRRRQFVHGLDRRGGCRHGQVPMALPSQPARRLGFRLDSANGARGSRDRRRAPQSAHASAEERIFLCAGPADRKAHLGRKAGQGHLGGAHRFGDGPPGGSEGRPLREPAMPSSGRVPPARTAGRACPSARRPAWSTSLTCRWAFIFRKASRNRDCSTSAA